MLVPDPCFIESIRRSSGSKRILVHIANGTGQPVDLAITDVRKPEWLDIEGAMIGDRLRIRKAGKQPLVVNINTDHRFFPEEASAREEIRFEFEGGLPPVTIFLYLQEIIATVESFRGTFAMDFGTTNTCYAWKGRVGDRMQIADAVRPPEASREIPTLVRFKDISNGAYPIVEIGNHARDFIARHAGKTQQYCISIKRLLGSPRELTILDDRSGLEPGRFQRYRPEQISAFAITEVLREAEGRIGQRIEQVIATFPVLYNRRRQEALRRAFRDAFTLLNREWRDDRLILRLDETNAAAFNYVYGTLLDQFRRFTVQNASHRLLSYDYGGGTIDVSLLDVDMERDAGGRVSIRTKVLGVTGDPALGGDMVTLAVLRVLKFKLAVHASRIRLDARRQAAEAAQRAAAAAATAANPWAIGSAAAQPAAKADDPWASLAAAAAPAPVAPAENQGVTAEADEDPATADIQCDTPEDALAQAWDLLTSEAETVDLACRMGADLAAAVAQICLSGQKTLGPAAQADLARTLEDAIDLVLPTRWKVLESRGDLIGKEVARKLFYELWLPAEVLKIRAASDPSTPAPLTDPLHRIAKYTGVPADRLAGVTISEAEINAAVEPALRRSVAKAAHLLRTAGDGGDGKGGGLSFGGLTPTSGASARPVTVLLAGNGARLPLVRRLVSDLCQVDPAQVVMDPRGAKASVAQGACEEHILRRDFGGEGGLIRYDAGDLVHRLPYTLGVFHRELAMLGYAGGFAPVMPRGTPVGAQVVLTEALQVVHRDAGELPIYAWFHDHELGAPPADPRRPVEPTSLGWFDLRAPEEEPWSQPFSPETEAQLAALGDAFAVVLVMDENRELTLVRRDRRCHRLKQASEQIDDAEYPFSGIH